ncbi:MAG: hypothetical protein M1309_04490 [Actinobacteria bacterium]|nr:hypothetical protein [Actinomycetota bacterium]
MLATTMEKPFVDQSGVVTAVVDMVAVFGGVLVVVVPPQAEISTPARAKNKIKVKLRKFRIAPPQWAGFAFFYFYLRADFVNQGLPAGIELIRRVIRGEAWRKKPSSRLP